MIKPKTLHFLVKEYERKVERSPYYGGQQLVQKPIQERAEPEYKDPIALYGANDLWEPIKSLLDSNQFALLVVNGMPGTGKTTVGHELAHISDQNGHLVFYSSGADIFGSFN